jgi:hypothetical protein
MMSTTLGGLASLYRMVNSLTQRVLAADGPVQLSGLHEVLRVIGG